MSTVTQRISSLLVDKDQSRDDKIHTLRQLEADALAKERGATEGFTPVDGDDGEDLKAIEKALRRVGETPVEGGAASL